ncbi:MAG: hypothetical protein CMM01_24205 [Rhodopirellula sp.]|nr:hypothetical protein [Rhodopirellula sp.]
MYGFAAGSHRSLEFFYACHFRTFLADCQTKLARPKYVHKGQALFFAKLTDTHATQMILRAIEETF